jgi:ferredoxin-fold anticodon binding domain-containing protein
MTKKEWEKIRRENLYKNAQDFSLKFEEELYTEQVDVVVMLQTCIQISIVLRHIVFNT